MLFSILIIGTSQRTCAIRIQIDLIINVTAKKIRYLEIVARLW